MDTAIVTLKLLRGVTFRGMFHENTAAAPELAARATRAADPCVDSTTIGGPPSLVTTSTFQTGGLLPPEATAEGPFPMDSDASAPKVAPSRGSAPNTAAVPSAPRIVMEVDASETPLSSSDDRQRRTRPAAAHPRGIALIDGRAGLRREHCLLSS